MAQQGLIEYVESRRERTFTTAEIVLGVFVIYVDNAAPLSTSTDVWIPQDDVDDNWDSATIDRIEYDTTGEGSDAVYLVTPLDNAYPDTVPVEGDAIIKHTVAGVLVNEGTEMAEVVEVQVDSALQATLQLREGVREPYERELVSFDYRDGDLYLLGVDGTVAIDTENLDISQSDILDGNVPATSPAVSVSSFGVGGLRATWSPVANADSVTYEVYASLTSPVTLASELVGRTTGTSLAFSKLGGQQIPVDGDFVYVAVRATDGDGPATMLGAEGSGAAIQAGTDLLNVGQLNAATIEAMKGFFSEVTSDIVLVNGKILVGDEQSSHIEIDPAKGLILYGPNGMDVLVKLDMTDAQLSEFTGRINASQLSVLNGLELRSTASKIANDAVLTLVSVVANPATPMSLNTTTATFSWVAPPTGFTEWGIWRESNTVWYQLIYNTSTKVTQIRTIQPGVSTPTATVTLAASTTRLQPSGLVKYGTDFYTLRIDNGTSGSRYWYLCRYNSSGGLVSSGAIAKENTASGALTKPTVGWDETNTRLIVATPDRAKMVLHTYSTSTYSPSANFMVLDPVNMAGTVTPYLLGDDWFTQGELRYVGRSNFDYGSSRLIIADSYGTARTYNGTTHAYIDAFTFETNPKAVAWDGSVFRSAHDTSSLRMYSTFKGTTTASRTMWFQYAWETSAAGTQQTLPSPAASIVLPDRRYITGAWQKPTSGTTWTRMYRGVGATQPANSAMFHEADFDASTISYTFFYAPPTSGNNPRTVSDFTTGTPAQFKSETGSFYVKGNGDTSVRTPVASHEIANKGYVDSLPSNTDTGWLSPTLTNGWLNYGGGSFGDVKYRKVGNQVLLKGVARDGTADAAIFTLPAGFRPVINLIMTAVVNNKTSGAASTGTAHTHGVTNIPIRLNINSAGVVSTTGAGGNSYVSLDGLSFWID